MKGEIMGQRGPSLGSGYLRNPIGTGRGGGQHGQGAEQLGEEYDK